MRWILLFLMIQTSKLNSKMVKYKLELMAPKERIKGTLKVRLTHKTTEQVTTDLPDIMLTKIVRINPENAISESSETSVDDTSSTEESRSVKKRKKKRLKFKKKAEVYYPAYGEYGQVEPMVFRDSPPPQQQPMMHMVGMPPMFPTFDEYLFPNIPEQVYTINLTVPAENKKTIGKVTSPPIKLLTDTYSHSREHTTKRKNQPTPSYSKKLKIVDYTDHYYTPEILSDGTEHESSSTTDITTISTSKFTITEPVTTTQPTTTTESTTTAQLTTTTTSTMRTTTTTQTTTTMQPTTTTEPTTTTQPATTTESSTTIEPTTSVEQTTSMEPITSTEPTTTMEPITPLEPSTTIEPTIYIDPATHSGDEDKTINKCMSNYCVARYQPHPGRPTTLFEITNRNPPHLHNILFQNVPNSSEMNDDLSDDINLSQLLEKQNRHQDKQHRRSHTNLNSYNEETKNSNAHYDETTYNYNNFDFIDSQDSHLDDRAKKEIDHLVRYVIQGKKEEPNLFSDLSAVLDTSLPIV